MAFEPRIVRPDDFSQPDEIASEGRVSGARAAEGRVLHEGATEGAAHLQAEDHWLPDDLQELATQLSADAVRLADCNTAAPGGDGVGHAHVGGRGRRLGLWAAAAAVLLGAGVWMVGREERPVTRPGALATSATETASSQPDSQLIPKEPAQRNPTAPEIPASQSPLPHLTSLVSAPVVDRNPLEARNGSAVHIAELSVGGEAAPPRVPRDELGMLQAQLQAFERVIVKLQAEVRRRDQLLEETTDMVKALTAEVETLRKQQEAAK